MYACVCCVCVCVCVRARARVCVCCVCAAFVRAFVRASAYCEHVVRASAYCEHVRLFRVRARVCACVRARSRQQRLRGWRRCCEGAALLRGSRAAALLRGRRREGKRGCEGGGNFEGDGAVVRGQPRACAGAVSSTALHFVWHGARFCSDGAFIRHHACAAAREASRSHSTICVSIGAKA